MCGSVGVQKGAHWVYMGVHFALWVYTLLHAPKETLKHFLSLSRLPFC